jgi:hypothetical protein
MIENIGNIGVVSLDQLNGEYIPSIEQSHTTHPIKTGKQ